MRRALEVFIDLAYPNLPGWPPASAGMFGVVRACIGEKMPPYFEDHTRGLEESFVST